MTNPIHTDMSRIELKARVHGFVVNYPRRQAILSEMIRLLAETSHSRDPKGMFIGGNTGVGKTTLLETFMNRYPRIETDEGSEIPVIYAAIPSVATVKGLANSILIAGGDPRADRGSHTNQVNRAIKLVRDCKTRAIVFDELQHIIDRESDRIKALTADTVKQIMDATGVPIIGVGLPHAEAILTDNPQLDRRFPDRHFLDPFAFDTAEGRAEFAAFLDHVDRALPFPERSGLASPATAEKLFEVTGGTLAFVMLIVRRAAELAIDRGAANIEGTDLEAAFRRAVHKPQARPAPKTKRGGKASGKSAPVTVPATVGQVLRT